MRRKIYNYKPIISRTTRSAILTAPTKFPDIAPYHRHRRGVRVNRRRGRRKEGEDDTAKHDNRPFKADSGKTFSLTEPKPAAFIIVEISPCTIVKSAIFSSKRSIILFVITVSSESLLLTLFLG